MSETIKCINCSANVPVEHRFCGTCGQSMADVPRAEDAQHKSIPAGLTAHLVRIHGGGTDGEVYPLNQDRQYVGRTDGHIVFQDDPFVSPIHAAFYMENGRLFVSDEGSRNGVYCRIAGTIALSNGDMFMAGEEIMRVEMGDPGGQTFDDEQTLFFGSPRPISKEYFRVRQILEGGEHGLCHYASGGPITIGREGTVLEFPNDRFISGRHCSVEFVGNQPRLTDLNSRNGTFVRLKEPRELKHKDFVFIGRQLLRVDIFEGSTPEGAL